MPLAVIGAPTSLGAFAPGQEQAPRALREAGLVERLSADDLGDIPLRRWRPDPEHRTAQHPAEVAEAVREVAERVETAVAAGLTPIVLGGDCTVGIGTVAGARPAGLIYFDMHPDLNTPGSVRDGALDWMGVAHMLGLPGAVPELANVGAHAPLLTPDQVLFFGAGNVTPPERAIIDQYKMAEIPLGEVAADPAAAAHKAAGWGRKFERLLIHLDVDVLDYLAMPLAENTRRNIGLDFDQLMASLTALLGAPNFMALTVCEVNPDHGEADGATLARFADALAESFAAARRVKLASRIAEG
jgi:arginase